MPDGAGPAYNRVKAVKPEQPLHHRHNSMTIFKEAEFFISLSPTKS